MGDRLRIEATRGEIWTLQNFFTSSTDDYGQIESLSVGRILSLSRDRQMEIDFQTLVRLTEGGFSSLL